MIPRDFIYKYMFIYLYDFANGKILLYILALYIVIPFYYQVLAPETFVQLAGVNPYSQPKSIRTLSRRNFVQNGL